MDGITALYFAPLAPREWGKRRMTLPVPLGVCVTLRRVLGLATVTGTGSLSASARRLAIMTQEATDCDLETVSATGAQAASGSGRNFKFTASGDFEVEL